MFKSLYNGRTNLIGSVPASGRFNYVKRLAIVGLIFAVVLSSGLIFFSSTNNNTPASAATINITTHHNDIGRSGANLNETSLTTANVNVNSFGKLFARAVDGQIYAQPLYLTGLAIPNKGTHNVVIVATMHNSVYAFDADDPAQSAPLWQVNLGPSAPVPNNDFGNRYGPLHDIHVEIGILSTPVIDLSTNTIYLVAFTLEGPSRYAHRLHALDITTGQHKANINGGQPKLISASVSGSGAGNVGGTVTFQSMQQGQRPGLLLLGGNVYIGFASYADTDPYHGWIMSYSAASLAQNVVYNTDPNGSEGGIWMAGQGLVSDGTSIYAMVGNGTTDIHTGGSAVGEAFIKLNQNLQLTDYFLPSNYDSLNSSDSDLGSAGPILLPGTTSILGGGKQGVLYLLNRNNLGHFSTSDNQIIQHFQATNGHIHGSPVFWNGPNGANVYVWSEYDHLKDFKLVNGTLNTTPSQSMMADPNGMPGGMLSVSANGSTTGSGIVWANVPYSGDANTNTVPGVLRAFDASNIGNELWNSYINQGRDDFGNFAKFCAPTVANGKVYMATFSNQLVVYGLLHPAAPYTNYTITNKNNNLVIDDPGFATTPSTTTNPDVWGSDNGTNQKWNIISAGTNLYKIVNVYSGLAIDDPASSTTSGTTMDLWTSNTGTNQQWSITKQGDGSFQILNKASNMALEYPGLTSVAGTKLDQATWTGANNQKWLISPAFGSTSTTTKYEAESLTSTTNGPANTISSDTSCSGGSCMVFQATAIGNVVTYTVQVATAGTYDLRVGVKKYTNKGIFQFASNGVNHGTPQDEYAATASFPELDIGSVTFNTAGTKSFTFTVTGKNASSTGYTIGLDYITLISQ